MNYLKTKNISKILFCVIFSFCVLNFYACSDKKDKNIKINEGAITYKISYAVSEKENPLVAIMPTEAVLKFQNNNISLMSEGFYGVFSTKFISEFKKPKSNILLKVMGKKWNYQFPKDELSFIYDKGCPSKVEFRDSTKIIAGYKCKKAILYFKDEEPVPVFYTQEIGIKNPNRNTPHLKIPGVMMEFETTMNALKTRFIAEKVSNEVLKPDEFTVPKEYIATSKDSLINLMSGFNK
ncbi:MAG: hypothetical protein N4A49_03760 [Marinifilaceae bacterium]|jgi:GLPGLI family protein|nr:hypothetical protein [Marinifilaceae bacterium]